MAGIKITPADKWFSKCVRERANWICEKCGAKHAENSQGLHTSHFWGRGNWSVRFHPNNAECLCYGCHLHYGGHQRISEVLDEDQSKELLDCKNDIALAKAYRRTKGKGEISRWYKDQCEIMRQKRSEGVTGCIEFDRFDPNKN